MKLAIVFVTALLLVASVVGCQQQPEPVTPSKGPTTLAILVESNTVEVGSSFMVSGSNFKPKEWVFAEFEYRFSNGRAECVAYDEADEQGSIHIIIEVPEDIVPGDYEVKIYTGSRLNIKDRRLLTTLPIYVQGVEIRVEPLLGSYLSNSRDELSGVILKDVQIKTGICDKEYFSPGYPFHTVKQGDPCLIVSGHIQNQHKENFEIAMYAEGYNEAGNQSAWTLDHAHIAGQIGLHLEYGKTTEFTLHMNSSKDTRTIRIYANNYAVTPP